MIDLDFRGWMELVRTLVVPLIAWVAIELRGLRLKMVEVETWIQSHDHRDDERFEDIKARIDRNEGRIGSLEATRRRS